MILTANASLIFFPVSLFYLNVRGWCKRLAVLHEASKVLAKGQISELCQYELMLQISGIYFNMHFYMYYFMLQDCNS